MYKTFTLLGTIMRNENNMTGLRETGCVVYKSILGLFPMVDLVLMAFFQSVSSLNLKNVTN
jgi:hypothetical protein